MKNYKEFTITAEPFNAEVLSSILWELEISGINEEVNCLKVFADIDSSVTVDLISLMLSRLKDEKLVFNFTVEMNVLEEKNWNEDWEKSVNVIEISDRLVIKPTFREYVPTHDQLIITIDPKMSFGTGEHQTTKLVLRFVEKYIKKGVAVLDVGSGTGVLAIASVKLGAKSAVAVDNDEWCLDNGKENCGLNNVGNAVDVRLGVVQDVQEKNFGLVLANIQKNILMEISSELKNRLDREGVLILSGLLVSDEEDIVKEYEKLGLKMIDMDKMGEWIALVFKFPE